MEDLKSSQLSGKSYFFKVKAIDCGEMEKARQTKLVAPDGGYGWVATFGVSLVNVRSPPHIFQFTLL